MGSLWYFNKFERLHVSLIVLGSDGETERERSSRRHVKVREFVFV